MVFSELTKTEVSCFTGVILCFYTLFCVKLDLKTWPSHCSFAFLCFCCLIAVYIPALSFCQSCTCMLPLCPAPYLTLQEDARKITAICKVNSSADQSDLHMYS